MSSRSETLLLSAKLAGVTIWIASVAWFVQGHSINQAKTAQEMRLRKNTDAVLASWSHRRCSSKLISPSGW
jgi:hypothetical protein